MKINILYQFNDKYAPYAGVSITSLLINNQHFDEVDIYILEDCLDCVSKENKAKFQRIADEYNRNIVFVNTEHIVDLMKKNKIPMYRGSYATNMKMFYAECITFNHDRTLYIDADTIIVDKIDELVSISLEGKSIGMCLDSLGSIHRNDIGLNSCDYFNAGIILFDNHKWIEHKYQEKIVDHVKKIRTNYPAPDQDLININCVNDIFRLDCRYNLQPHHMKYEPQHYLNIYVTKNYYTKTELENAKEQPAIIHTFRYLGEFPWHKNNLHPANKYFDEYLKVSLWNEYVKEKADVSLLLKTEKFLYQILPSKLFLHIFQYAHERFLAHANKLSLEEKSSSNM
ncbi:MAG: glycosyltransferase family 8 protein [Eubacteriales bacterium]